MPRPLILSFLLLLLSSATALANPGQPECVSYAGQTACGYNCTGYAGKLECAQTPWGVCEGYAGKLMCWDPPRIVRRALRWGFAIPAPACEGYAGELECWDPPMRIIRSFLRSDEEPPRAECETHAGSIECGYNCKTYGSEIACANSPGGICTSHQGELVCWEPQPFGR
jgi:hypothetical protein